MLSLIANSRSIYQRTFYPVDSYGLSIEYIITVGDIHNSTAANDLIELLPYADYLVADKGYDSEKVRDSEQGATPVISIRCNSKAGNAGIDWCLYKYIHLIKNVFVRLKHFRSIATRYEKLKIY